MSFPAVASFPASQWDGSSASRTSSGDGEPVLEVYRGPDGNDWSSITAEVRAMQKQLGAGGLSGTTATTGYAFIPYVAGAPSGTPANVPAGFKALAYDSTGHKLSVYDGAWKQTAALT